MEQAEVEVSEKKRVVAIAIDDSEHAENALKCELIWFTINYYHITFTAFIQKIGIRYRFMLTVVWEIKFPYLWFIAD